MPVSVHIIEDDAAVRDATRELVAGAGRRVFAYDSPAAFFAAPAPQPRDIVVLDIHFPFESGVEAALRIQRDFPGIRIIVVSGIRAGPYERALSAMAPAASFRKPIDGAAFAACVDRLVAAT